MDSGTEELLIYDRDLSILIKYFEYSILGRKKLKNITRLGASTANPNFWFEYIKEYKRWQRGGSDPKKLFAKKRLLRFGSMIKSIKVFENDLNTDENRNHFLARIRSSDRVEGLVFELSTAIHFKRQGLETHWIGARTEGIIGDIEISLDGNPVAIVECSFLERSEIVNASIEELINRLINGANRKLESSKDHGLPRIVAIKIPQHVDWESDKARKLLDFRVNAWLRGNRLTSVNALQFLGESGFRKFADATSGLSGVEPDQPVYAFKNKVNAKYQLPIEVESRLTSKYE